MRYARVVFFMKRRPHNPPPPGLAFDSLFDGKKAELLLEADVEATGGWLPETGEARCCGARAFVFRRSSWR